MKEDKLHFRFATEEDVDLYYEWANDPAVRSNSYSSSAVIYENHVKWFREKLNNPDYFFYLFLNLSDVPVGQVRIVKGPETIIGISIDPAFRGKSLGVEMLRMACEDFLNKHKKEEIIAYIKKENTASYFTFKKAGFSDEEVVMEQNCLSYKLYKKYKTNE